MDPTGTSTPGVTSTLAPASGTGPVYLDDEGFPDPGLTSTSSFGGVLYVNVVPGTVEVSFYLPGATCVTPEDGWGGAGAGRVRIPAEADSVVFVPVVCR